MRLNHPQLAAETGAGRAAARPALVCFLLMMLAASRAFSASYINIDWVQPTHPAYPLLKTGASQAVSSHWLVPRMASNQPLPQASAHDLAEEIYASPKVNPGLKDSLKRAFPYETDAAGGKEELKKMSMGEMKGRLERLQPLLDELIDRRKNNTYSPATNPQVYIEIFNRGNGFRATGKLLGERRTSSAQVDLRGGKDGQGGLSDYFNENGLRFRMLSNHADLNIELRPFEIISASDSGYYTGDGKFWFGHGGVSSVNMLNQLNGAVFSLDLTLPNPWVENFRVKVGKIGVIMDNLILAGIAKPSDLPFFANDSLDFEDVIAFEPGEKAVTGFQFFKAGSQGWWIFDSSQIYLVPQMRGYVNNNPPVGSNLSATNVVAGRVDLMERELLMFHGTQLWLSGLSTWPSYDLLPVSPNPLELRQTAYATGMRTQLLGGEALFHFASSNLFSGGPQSSLLVTNDVEWSDTAYTLNLSRPLGNLALGLDLASLGPKYVVGPRQGLWTPNYQYGNFRDSSVDDPRPLNVGQTAYQTLLFDTGEMVNNSQRLNMKASYSGFWGNIGFNGGFNAQTLPSGPWIQTTWTLNNDPRHDPMMERLWGHGGFANNPGWDDGSTVHAYNRLTSAPAYQNGVQVNRLYNRMWPFPPESNPPTFPPLVNSGKWNWQDLQSVGEGVIVENVLLSRNGVGDFELRPDSVKTVNFLRGSAQFDLRAVFDLAWPFILQGYHEIRDVGEEGARLASYGGDSLFSQMLSELFLTWGINQNLTLQGYAARETWTSRASAFLLDTEELTLGAGFDLPLPEIVNSLLVEGRARIVEHHDFHYPTRDFQAVIFRIGFYVVY